MKKKDIISALESADENYILEAGIAGGHFRDSAPERTDCQAGAAPEGSAAPILLSGQRRRRPWTAAAAVLLLALACGAAWALLLHAPIRKPGPTPGGTEQLSAPRHGPESATAESDVTPTDTEFVWPSETLAPDDAADTEITPDPELEQALLELKIGGISLGQPQAEVLALYGEPASRSVSDYVRSDGTKWEHWLYHFGDGENLLIDFVDAGVDGFVVDEIICSARLEGEMPLGIQIGMPFDEAEAAFAQSPILNAVKYRKDCNRMNVGTGSMQGSLSAVVTDVHTGQPGHLRLDVSYDDQAENGPHYVTCIFLGNLYREPPYDETPDPEEQARQRRFESGEITVWLPEDGGWQGKTFRDAEAKVLEMAFAISLPEPWEYDGSDPIAVLDFHNGYAAALFDEQAHGAVYRVMDRAAFEAGLSSGGPLRGLELWEYGQFAPNTTQFVKDPEQVSADWDLNYNVDAPMKKLLAALETKNTILFRASDDRTVLFREKKHYVMAYAYGENEKITGYARFFEDHSMDIVAGYKVPLIELDEPAGLLGMKLDAVKAAWGEPCFETVVNGTSCPGYLTLSGYVVVLHPNTESAVVEIELYDHDPTPVTIR